MFDAEEGDETASVSDASSSNSSDDNDALDDSEIKAWVGDPQPPAQANDVEDEMHPPCLSFIEHRVSSDKKGCVHIVSNGALACDRTLKDPVCGIGRVKAFNSGRPLSPRCMAALSKPAKDWWVSTDSI